MERTKQPTVPLSKQIKAKIGNPTPRKESNAHPEGNFTKMISTGSTLLDLAISGGRIRGGGIPAGIVMEVFGPNSAGKTVLLCEIAGAIQRQGGEARFDDPEARLNSQFAQMFGFNINPKLYSMPNTVDLVFKNVINWKPSNPNVINGTFADSLAALSTKLEMENEDGDKMGMRRAKEFSEGFRKIARIITENNLLMVCSNQVRENADAGNGPAYKSTGGFAIGFYSSLRLRADNPQKIWVSKSVNGKEVKRPIGVQTTFEVFKSSVWKPYRTAPLYIIFDYGIDDIRANLQFIKTYKYGETYMLNDVSLGVSMETAIRKIEKDNLQNELKQETIDLWEIIDGKFNTERQPKR